MRYIAWDCRNEPDPPSAAILAADVAAYSRLIGADEERIINRLRSIRADFIDPKITEHRVASSKRPVMACWSHFQCG
jgi:hypothetical protein